MRAQAVLETVVYCDDLAAAESFYVGVVGLEKVSSVPDRHVFLRCGLSMFLVFRASTTAGAALHVDGSAIPTHGATGAGHVAFRVSEAEIPAWRAHLAERSVAIESEVDWPDGGSSLYVRDPDGNSVEFATASLWNLADNG